MKKVFVSGAAGFIGYSLSLELLKLGLTVIGIDNLNNYYDISLKDLRLKKLKSFNNFYFKELDLKDGALLDDFLGASKPDIFINLAAQAGVRYSAENPRSYIDSNIIGFYNVLEAVKNNNISKCLFASSSSIYGFNDLIPFSEDQITDSPASLYAATKKSNELLAHSYSVNYGISLIGLRFFTVYGPFGRPDMAYYKFTENIDNGQPIVIYNEGKMSRDMTYIDDIVSGIIAAMDYEVIGRKSNYEVFNLGNSTPIELLTLVQYIEDKLGKKAKIIHQESTMEVKSTFADIDRAKKYLGYDPKTGFNEGMNNFINWYKGKEL